MRSDLLQFAGREWLQAWLRPNLVVLPFLGFRNAEHLLPKLLQSASACSRALRKERPLPSLIADFCSSKHLARTNHRPQGREHIAFAAPCMVRITPMRLDQMGGELICQKAAFLCGARGIQVSIAFQKKIGAGLFGGEGFIMQRLRGDSIALVQAGGRGKHTEEGSMLGGLGRMLMGSHNG